MLANQFGFLLFFLIGGCLSYEGVKGRSSQHGIKTYGGYVHDSGLPSNFVHSPEFHRQQEQQQQQQANNYQPYGWNYNQPTRTYGGVMQPNYQNQQGFGWFGGENQFANQYPSNNQNNNHATFPNTPSLFLPNFVPPVYFNNAPAPYPRFPNFNFNQFPFAPSYPNAGGQNHGGQGNNQAGGNQFGGQSPQYPQQGNQIGEGNNQQSPSRGNAEDSNKFNGQVPQPVVPLNVDQHPQSTNDKKFLTNAFFGDNNQGQHGNRQWTQDDEMKWQATTKAPYFENKVPGLECTLPASAVLGATTALKASSLLPLNVPIGKPILSCNATELLQAQINLNGIIYDCLRSAITMSCPRVDSNGLVQDECRGETLECDVRMRQNSRSVSCTNGTLISNHPIVCKSATLMEKKNVLNCQYKGIAVDEEPLTEQTTIRSHISSTRSPVRTPDVSVLPPPIVLPPPVAENADKIDDIHIRFSQERKKLEILNLHQEVQKAMDTVFPHELLSVAARKMYLPPKFSSDAQISGDLKDHLNGVFPHELLAISQTAEASTEKVNEARGQGLSLDTRSESNARENQQAVFTQQRQQQWDVNVNRKTGNPGSSIKTQSRFGGVTEAYDEDRLIFAS